MTITQNIQEIFDPVIAEVGEVQLVPAGDEGAGIPYYQVVVRYRDRKPETHVFYTADGVAKLLADQCRDTMLQKQKRQQTKMTTFEKLQEFFSPAISKVSSIKNINGSFYSFRVDYMFRPSRIYDFSDAFSVQDVCKAAIAMQQHMKQKMADQKRNRSYMQ